MDSHVVVSRGVLADMTEDDIPSINDSSLPINATMNFQNPFNPKADNGHTIHSDIGVNGTRILVNNDKGDNVTST